VVAVRVSSLVDALRAGTHGVALEVPSGWTQTRDAPDHVHFVEDATRAIWYLMWFPGVVLDLGASHRGDLARALEHHARAMFDSVVDAQVADGDAGGHPPRTADPSWSPIVDVEHVIVDGAPALRTVHRMSYQPGSEIVMAHLLIPLRDGLFEARVVCCDAMTGVRESVLLIAQGRGAPVLLPQRELDDPRHDAGFPDHALSRARAAIRWLRDDSGLRVTAPASPLAGGEAVLAGLGCALTPPPRFVHASTDDEVRDASFRRCSFCGTDGIETLLVRDASTDLGQLPASSLRDRATAFTRALHDRSGVERIRVDSTTLDSIEGGLHVLVTVQGDGHQGRIRNLFRWFRDEGGRPWFVAMIGDAAVPLDVRAAELDAAVRSWRLTRPAPPPPRAWWKIW
jgi:hypothetical protein